MGEMLKMSQKVHNLDNFGTTIRKIREAKQLTQKQIAGNIPFSTYRKIEANLTSCTLPNFVQITQNLHIDIAEFMYIHQEYQLSERQTLLKLFIDIKSTLNKEGFIQFFDYCDSYLQTHDDPEVLNLQCALKGLYQYSLTENREECYRYIKPLWQSLFDRKWFYWDALTISCILFFLKDASEIHETVQKLVDVFKRYDLIYQTKSSILRVYLNAAYGLKCINKITDGEEYVTLALELSTELGERVLYYDTLYKKAEIEFSKGHVAYANRLATESFNGLEKYEENKGDNSFLSDNKADWEILSQRKKS